MKAHLGAGAAVAIVATVCASASTAGPAEDGNAGLDAMNRGDYPAAARLFSAVLKAPGVGPDDREYAYVNLGTIYLRQGRYVQAVANFENAVALKADDTEAQSQLELAQAGKNGADPLTVHWGGLRLLDGGTWVAATSREDRKHKVKDDPFFYAAFGWSVRGETLSFTGKDQLGGAVAGTLTRDRATGVITESTTSNGNTTTEFVEPTLNGYIEMSSDGTARTTVKQVDPTTFSVVQETYANNVWSQTKAYRLRQSQKLAQDMDKKIQGRMLKHCAGAGAKAGLITALTGQDQALPPECGGPQTTDAGQQ